MKISTLAAVLTMMIALPLIGGARAAPGADYPRISSGYHLNDNGYRTYYSVAYFLNADCRDHLTAACRQRLDRDAAFCDDWAKSGKCGQEAATPSR